MSTPQPPMIFVNLPVQDLDKSKAFFAALGYRFNPAFTDENAACMVVSDSIFVMLLVKPFFQQFTTKAIADAQAQTEVITCLSADSRNAVDVMVDKALAAGASELQPARDEGFMYQRGFQDLDGHLWEIAHMDGEPG
ncbi:VOC family protein [Stenotrophomonas maltophilia]|uniref:VOC family protein n=1 Tax=Stenotrophomonas maltophilia TaxID=40324 RepID=UPI002ACC7B7F|nr:VOC family protein [Stenotrophomonas maltophilia]MDZ5843058.1 VOC family protein [Stenotrophomonas maltophilia]